MRKVNKNLRANVDDAHVKELREKLMREISDCQRQLSELKLENNQLNFAKMQTLKDFISARESMLRNLPNYGI
jgi:FtsZ-binding cell division protein ZapB